MTIANPNRIALDIDLLKANPSWTKFVFPFVRQIIIDKVKEFVKKRNNEVIWQNFIASP